MKTREKLLKKIEDNNAKIKKLHSDNIALKIQEHQICDDKQRYTEQVEVRGRGKKKEDIIVGRIHWREDFKDEDTGETITIKRSQAVRIGDTWYEV